MKLALKLTHDEPRLVFLALVYHLGRPGSELDPETKMPVEHGMREVKLSLGNHLMDDSAVIELDEHQFSRLLSAIYGSVNELRLFHMRNGALSTVERFTETARDLFPALAEEPEAALDVAESMMMLHRRMERAVNSSGRHADAQSAQTATAQRRKRFWPFR
jgi:hypothetical protein